MAKARLLAFLLCENATRDAGGKVTLHGIFDRIIAPQSPREQKIFFVYYRLIVEEPCAVGLSVTDPNGGEVSGSWRDSLSQPGPVQTVWALTSALLKRPGPYLLRLMQENENKEPTIIAEMSLAVELSEV
jgi:Family of unknown function (DUF6941)